MTTERSPQVVAMLKRRAAQPKYETLAKWRNGWQLIKHPTTGQHYLRKMFNGQFPVNVQKDGASWAVRDPANNNERVYVERLR